jgi:hypothetical protein
MNYWGEPDDENELPAWMDPKKCHQVNQANEMRRKSAGSLTEAINAALSQPAVPQVPDRPDIMSDNH